jgi:hypothetical protein
MIRKIFSACVLSDEPIDDLTQVHVAFKRCQ